MPSELLYLHVDSLSDDLSLEGIRRLRVCALATKTELIDIQFGRKGLTYQSLAPVAKQLLLGLKENVALSFQAQKNTSLLKKAYATLSFKLSCKLYDVQKVISVLAMQSNDATTLLANHYLSYEKACADLHQLFKHTSPSQITQCRQLSAQNQRVPTHLIETVAKLPNSPGVYLFLDAEGQPIYIGKSVRIKERVLSHFSARFQHPKELKLFRKTQAITYEQTNGEFGALLLESQLIKRHRPIFNRRLRRASQLYTIDTFVNKRGYTALAIVKLNINDFNLGQGNSIGLYRSQRQAKQHIEVMVKAHALCGVLTGLENGRGPCFLHQLEMCHGACIEHESAQSYNQRLFAALRDLDLSDWPFDSAIAINERGSRTDLKWHVFDKWCYLGSAKSLAFARQKRFVTKDVISDIDASKYLASFIKKHQQRVVALG